MPEWLEGFLTGTDMALAASIWNTSMKAVSGLLAMEPAAFSAETWTFVNETLYPFALSVGLSLLNLFFIIGWMQTLTRLHENITLEMMAGGLIKAALVNVLFLNLRNMIRQFFLAASLMTGSIFTLKAPRLEVPGFDLGSVMFYNLFGLLYVVTAIICSFLILATVYGRYIRLYLLLVAAPFALPALAGGDETRSTFTGWVKGFLLSTFEIVMVALVMVICFKLMGDGVDLFGAGKIAAEVPEGFGEALNSLFTMVMVTASVGGVHSFMTRTFAL